MVGRREEFKKHVDDLWRQAVRQLEDLKKTVLDSRDRLEVDLQRLRRERDRLLKNLGEQTFKLARGGKLHVPNVVKKTVKRLNQVVDTIWAREGVKKSRPKKKGTRKNPARKTKKSGGAQTSA